MEPAAAFDCVPIEMIHEVCTSLSEEDLGSLLETNQRLHYAVNQDVVWAKLVPEQVKVLESIDQQVDSSFRPDQSICRARQHLLRRNRLVFNWRNGKYRHHSIKKDDCFQNSRFKIFYKENYMFIQKRDEVQFWEISKEPVLLSVTLIPQFPAQIFVIADYLVVADILCKVNVHRINLEEKGFSFQSNINDSKTFPLDYSFSHGGNEVVRGEQALFAGSSNRSDSKWVTGEMDNYLVCVMYSSSGQQDEQSGALHIWDIEKAKKVGVFQSPLFGTFNNMSAIEGKELILRTYETIFSDQRYFKFDLSTKTFSVKHSTFDVDGCHGRISFHKGHCIVYRCNQDEACRFSLILEVIDFKTSAKLKERYFQNVDYRTQNHSVVYGKISLFSSDEILLVDVLTLETMVTIETASSIQSILLHTSVFGLIFLVTIEENGCLKIWDVEKKTAVVSVEDMVSPREQHGLLRDINVYISDASSKLVLFTTIEMFVMHFW